MISAMAVPSFMAIPSPRPAAAGVGLLPIVGTGFSQSVKRGVRLAREVLICVWLASYLAAEEAVMPRLDRVSSSRFHHRRLGILGRPVKPDDDGGERGAFVFHDKPPRPRGAMRPSFCKNCSPSKIEGAGNAGRLMRPRPRVRNKIKHTSVVTTVTPVSPGIPRAMVLTAYFVLSPATNSSCHRHPRIKGLSKPGRADLPPRI